MSIESRTYLVGLPVAVTVTGSHVSATIDLGEVGVAIAKYEPSPDEAFLEEHHLVADAEAAEAAIAEALVELAPMFVPSAEVIVFFGDVDDCECPDHDPWRAREHYHPDCPLTEVGEGFHVACPHCGNLDHFYEVDRSERWNPCTVEDAVQDDRLRRVVYDNRVDPLSKVRYADDGPNPLAGLPVLLTGEGSSGDGFQTDHFRCQSCTKVVDLPEWLATEWAS